MGLDKNFEMKIKFLLRRRRLNQIKPNQFLLNLKHKALFKINLFLH